MKYLFLFLAFFTLNQSAKAAPAEDANELQPGKSELLYLNNCKNVVSVSQAGDKVILNISSGQKCSEMTVNGEVIRFSRRFFGGYTSQIVQTDANNKSVSVLFYSRDKKILDSVTLKPQNFSEKSDDDYLQLSSASASVSLPSCIGSVSFAEDENSFYLSFKDLKNCDLLSVEEMNGLAFFDLPSKTFSLAPQKELRFDKSLFKGVKTILFKANGTAENSSGFPVLVRDEFLLHLSQ